MGKIPRELKEIIARNIRACRMRKFPGRGGGKKCAEAFGVSPQQWSPWETGKRTPDELRLGQIAEFFGVNVEFLRHDHSLSFGAAHSNPFGEEAALASRISHSSGFSAAGMPSVDLPGSPASFYWLARRLVDHLIREGVVVRVDGGKDGGR